ncbi:MAG: aminotransferase, partial [Arthrobacter sp.]
VYHIRDDEQFALDLLKQQKMLISHGRAFNWIAPDHFRLVTLPAVRDIEDAVGRIAEYLEDIRR